MAYEIVMPQLSDSMEEGKLISWKVKPGDTVHTGDVIAEVESDKAIMEVQSFRDGVVKELKVKEGESVPVGTVIAVIEEAGASSSATSAVGSERSQKSEVEGEKETVLERIPPKTQPPAPNTQYPKPKTESTNVEKSIIDELFGKPETKETTQYPLPTTHSNETGTASPRARALAAKYGLDIEALQKEGKLPIPAHAEDVRKYWERRYFTPKALELLSRYHLSTELFEKGKKHTEKEVTEYIQAHEIPLPESLSPMRKTVIRNVEKAARKPVYHIYDFIDTALMKKHESERFTLTVWLIKILGETMMRHEALRTTLGENGLQVWPNASISVAMAYGEALYMPVFRDVNRKSAGEIADELAVMKEKMRSGRIRPEELQGSTFGLSNLGMTGIERFDALIHGNDSGIAAVGSEKEGKIAVTLTLDHRIVNGWQGAEAMQTFKDLAKEATLFKE